MKTTSMISLAMTLTATASYAGLKPDFKSIFSEIDRTNSITEALQVRESHLKEMRHLEDFNRLTDMEALAPGEEFFTHYRDRIAGFISNNVGKYINPMKKEDKALFLDKIYPKVASTDEKMAVAEKGLSYVTDCEEFMAYAAKTDKGLKKKKYFKNYCKKEAGGASHLISVLFQPRILGSGRWDSVHFGDYYYVKKIYVSAEGVYRDAFFDVMVNGDTKGSIYVPGSDPAYIITVEDYADSLILRSLQGTAKITTILIDVE